MCLTLIQTHIQPNLHNSNFKGDKASRLLKTYKPL